MLKTLRFLPGEIHGRISRFCAGFAQAKPARKVQDELCGQTKGGSAPAGGEFIKSRTDFINRFQKYTNDKLVPGQPSHHNVSVLIQFTATGPERLDHALLAASQGQGLAHSRSQLQKWVNDGLACVNGETEKRPARKLAAGDTVALQLPPPAAPAFEHPRDAPFEVVFEDAHLLVVNKPAGVVVHPGAGTHAPTLVEGLLAAGKTLSPVGGPLRPGVVHRLDKDTSGLLVLAKTEAAHHALAAAFKNRTVSKTYWALVLGKTPPEKGEINQPIGRDIHHRTRMAVSPRGREALSRWRVLKMGEAVHWLEVTIHSGRTHQIRVHMAHLGCPLLGDKTYGAALNAQLLKTQGLPPALRQAAGERVWLRAVALGFAHPATGLPVQFSLADDEGFAGRVW